jgi:hypothetical protein
MNRSLLIPIILLLITSCDCVQEVNVVVLTPDSEFPIVDVKIKSEEHESQFGRTDGQGQYQYQNISGGLFGCPNVTLTFEKEGFLKQRIEYKSCCISDTVYLSFDISNDSFKYAEPLTKYFSGWVYYQMQTFGQFKFSNFQLTSEQPYSDYIEHTTPPEEYHKQIKDYLFYSPDKTKVLDIYSERIPFELTANGKIEALFSVDSEIFFFDVTNETRNRVLFGGSSYTFDEAVWISNDEILVVGDIQEDTDRQLSVWYANVRTKELKRYAQLVKQKNELINDYLTKVRLVNVGLYLDDQ